MWAVFLKSFGTEKTFGGLNRRQSYFFRIFLFNRTTLLAIKYLNNNLAHFRNLDWDVSYGSSSILIICLIRCNNLGRLKKEVIWKTKLSKELETENLVTSFTFTLSSPLYFLVGTTRLATPMLVATMADVLRQQWRRP